jgi:hypothetical protein
VTLFSAEQLLRLGAVAIGFNHTDLGNMALSSNDVIESLGSQPVEATGVVGYTPIQVLIN